MLKMMTRKILCIVLFAPVLLSAACSQKSSAYAESREDYAGELSIAKNVNRDEQKAHLEIQPVSPANRKLVTSASITIRLDNIDGAVPIINGLIEKYQGYAESMSSYETGRTYRLQIPAASCSHFIEEITRIGKVLHYSETTEDVTLKYYDMENRLHTKRTLIKTYQGYLARAATIDEILSVEERIAELQSEIENAERQFRLLGAAIDYSSVSLELTGSVSIMRERTAIGDSIKKLFSGFGKYVSIVIVVLLGIVVYGLPSAGILLLLYWLLLGKIGLLRKLYVLLSSKNKLS